MIYRGTTNETKALRGFKFYFIAIFLLTSSEIVNAKSDNDDDNRPGIQAQTPAEISAISNALGAN